MPSGQSMAISKNTRSPEGLPGKHYWQNKANYELQVNFDPGNRILSGKGTIHYFNNSPDTLFNLLLLLLPDMYKQGNPRDFQVAASDEHSGLNITNLDINGTPINPSRSLNDMLYMETYAWVDLDEPFSPQSENSIKLEWNYIVNKTSHMRTGQVDESSFFIAYWFPRIGVYDDIEGWNPFIYTGVGEFYNDFGDFDIKITLPKDFITWATGELQNPEDIFNDSILERQQAALQSDEVISIIRPEDIKTKITKGSVSNTWNYKAQQVSDFAFAFSDHFLWDGVSPKIGKKDQRVFISSAYPADSPDFPEVIHIALKSMTYMVHEIPGLPFPYPAITVFNGLDEMEYPMMVNNHSFEDLMNTFQLTAHELYHSYFPFMMGCNERKYAWMDEGLTSFFEYNIIRDLVDKDMISLYFLDHYQHISGTKADLPLITQSDLIRAPEYYAISYPKAAAFYSELYQEIGRDRFKELIKMFADNWEGKHPSGYDFINFILHVEGKELESLIIPWFYEYGFVDLAITGYEYQEDHSVVSLMNKGNYPAGFQLLVTFSDKSTQTVRKSASFWYNNTSNYTIRIENDQKILQLEIKQDIPIDVNKKNNLYQP